LVHRLDARVKLLLLLAFLVSLAILKHPNAAQLTLYVLYLVVVLWLSKLPFLRTLRSSLLVVPFVGLFGLILWVSGDMSRALVIFCKTYLSAFAVLLCIISTPLPELVRAAQFLRAPAFLVDITQLIYRYLFVVGGEFQVMRTAFRSRGGQAGKRTFQSASGMVAVLFGRAYERAAAVNNAMLSRGFTGVFPGAPKRHLRMGDTAGAAIGLVLIVLVRFA
jgi:cobalt/nickel transport system permease protein